MNFELQNYARRQGLGAKSDRRASNEETVALSGSGTLEIHIIGKASGWAVL
jgi:hypothetical protein